MSASDGEAEMEVDWYEGADEFSWIDWGALCQKASKEAKQKRVVLNNESVGVGKGRRSRVVEL